MAKYISFRKIWTWFCIFSDQLVILLHKSWELVRKYWLRIVLIIIAICILGIIIQSISYHYTENLNVRDAIAVSAYGTILYAAICIIAGFCGMAALCLLGSFLKSLVEMRKLKNQKLESIPEVPAGNIEETQVYHEHIESTHQNEQPKQDASVSKDDYVAHDNPRDIDTALLKDYLNAKLLEEPYCVGKTLFDGIVDQLKYVQIGYRKGAKDGKDYSDKDIIQIATRLHKNKFMKKKAKFTTWCTSLFRAMHLEIPGQIRQIEPEGRVLKLFQFLDRV